MRIPAAYGDVARIYVIPAGASWFVSFEKQLTRLASRQEAIERACRLAVSRRPILVVELDEHVEIVAVQDFPV